MNTRQRLRLCVYLGLAPLLPITVRLATLQVVRHDDLTSRVQNSTERVSIQIVPRGRILDRSGQVLAESVPAWSAFLDIKAFLESDRPAGDRLRAIESILKLSDGALDGHLKSKRRTVWLKRRMTYAMTARLKALKLRSIGFAADERRHYPNGDLARPLLGAVNADGRGSAGLEYAFNKRISGRAVRWKLTRDGAGRAIYRVPEGSVARPPDLRLTIDRTIQFFAERALARAALTHQAKSGIVVVQDPASGEVLALAEYPSNPMHLAAVQDVYEPGSTFKIVTAAAAIETKLLDPGETIHCENGRWQMTAGTSIRDHEKHGALLLNEIIRYSSNIGTAKLGLRLGAKTLAKYCRLFGFGYKTGVPIPAESAGILHPPESMRDVGLTRVTFGQGISVTALQLIGAFSAIANGGRLMEPRVVSSVGRKSARGAVVVRKVLKSATAQSMREILEEVVANGTGASAAIPGYRIAGKTGTAQKFDTETGAYSDTDYVASFAGFFPARRPMFSILVVLDSPQGAHYGSQVAAPVFAEIARRVLALRAVPPALPMPLRLSEEARPAALPRPRLLRMPSPAYPLKTGPAVPESFG